MKLTAKRYLNDICKGANTSAAAPTFISGFCMQTRTSMKSSIITSIISCCYCWHPQIAGPHSFLVSVEGWIERERNRSKSEFSTLSLICDHLSAVAWENEDIVVWWEFPWSSITGCVIETLTLPTSFARSELCQWTELGNVLLKNRYFYTYTSKTSQRNLLLLCSQV